MKRFYVAESLADAYLLRSRLLSIGIKAHVFNEFADGAVGELPFTHTWPEVWLERECDEQAAAATLEAHCKPAEAEGEIRCAACGESNPLNFEICWSCAAGLPQY